MKNQNNTNEFSTIILKHLLFMLLLFSVASTQFSCKEKELTPEVSIVGKWKLTNVQSPGADPKEIKEYVQSFSGIIWEYKNNGEMTISGKDPDGYMLNESGNYTIKNGTITAKGKGEFIDMEGDISIKGNQLTIDLGSKDFVMIFTKQK
jgi:Lipocalin-like domain